MQETCHSSSCFPNSSWASAQVRCVNSLPEHSSTAKKHPGSTEGAKPVPDALWFFSLAVAPEISTLAQSLRKLLCGFYPTRLKKFSASVFAVPLVLTFCTSPPLATTPAIPYPTITSSAPSAHVSALHGKEEHFCLSFIK